MTDRITDYITQSRTDDVKPSWDEKAILGATQDFFNGWAERVMAGLTDEQIKSMFNANTVEGEDVVQWKAKVDLYEECLAVLDDLAK